MPLAEALARRRSVRDFATQPLSLEEVGQLCWAAQGVTDETAGLRAAPSAGARYALTVFVVDGTGVSQYEPRGHHLREVVSGDLRPMLQAAAHDQPCVGAAPVSLVIAMDVSRIASKYGRRAERYALLEAGHAAQNVLLQATALGLGGVPVGAFSDEEVSTLLHLPANSDPVYLIPLGYPAGR
jgi:SagB-type dehydrogenase family enzyme